MHASGAWLMDSDAQQKLSNRTALLVALYSLLPKKMATADAAKFHRLGMVDPTFRYTNRGRTRRNSPTNLSGDGTAFSRLRNTKGKVSRVNEVLHRGAQAALSSRTLSLKSTQRTRRQA